MVGELLDAEKHHVREENVLFPLLEKHGVIELPAIVWMEHDKIREKKGELWEIVEKRTTLGFQNFKEQFAKVARSLNDFLSSHIFKENNILFPTALRVVAEKEWLEAREDFDEIGYCRFTPLHFAAGTVAVEKRAITPPSGGDLEFEIGTLSKEEVEAILDTLPIDVYNLCGFQ